MIKRLVSLLLAAVFSLTAVIPAAYAQVDLKKTQDGDIIELKEGSSEEFLLDSCCTLAMFLEKTQDPVSSEPSIATSTLRLSPETPHDYAYELFDKIYSFPRDDSVLKSQYLYHTIDAHTSGTTTITYQYQQGHYTRIFDERYPLSHTEDPQRTPQTKTINVIVTPALAPPKVELRLVPDNTTRLVTGSHKSTEILDISNKIIDAAFDKVPNLLEAFELTPSEFRAVRGAQKANKYSKRLKLYLERPIAKIPKIVAKMLPGSLGGLTIYETGNIYIPEQAVKKFVEENLKSKDTAWKPKIAAYGKVTATTLLKLSPIDLAAGLINEALKKIKVPRVDPEIYLEVIVTNPDNSVPLYYDICIDSPRVEHEGKELTRHTPLFVLEKTVGLGAKSRAYSSQVIQPKSGNKNIHRFSLTPELVYNESDPNLLTSTLKRYISDITVSGSWGEWKGEDEKIPGGKYEESIQLEVISLLEPKSEYQQMERFFSDMTLSVIELWESLVNLPGLSDSAFVEFLDSMPEGAPLMTPVDKIPPKTSLVPAQ